MPSPASSLDVLFPENPALCALLWSRKVRCIRDLIYVPPWELRDWLLVSEDEAAAVLAQAWESCAVPITTALAMASGSQNVEHVRTPLASFTEVLGGGLSGKFIEIAGPPGVGKTQFCLHLAALAASGGHDVFWLDAEQTFAPVRALELLEAAARSEGAGQDVNQGAEAASLSALQRIRRHVCESLQDLQNVAGELLHRAQQGGSLPALIIVDSIAILARNEGDVSTSRHIAIPRRQAALNTLAGVFKTLVKEPANYSPAVVPSVIVTNQVAGDPSSGKTRVALGHVWHHAVNWRLVLSYLPPGDMRGHGLKEHAFGSNRYLHIEKSPCVAPLTIEFAITACGLTEVACSTTSWVR